MILSLTLAWFLSTTVIQVSSRSGLGIDFLFMLNLLGFFISIFGIFSSSSCSLDRSIVFCRLGILWCCQGWLFSLWLTQNRWSMFSHDTVHSLWGRVWCGISGNGGTVPVLIYAHQHITFSCSLTSQETLYSSNFSHPHYIDWHSMYYFEYCSQSNCVSFSFLHFGFIFLSRQVLASALSRSVIWDRWRRGLVDMNFWLLVWDGRRLRFLVDPWSEGEGWICSLCRFFSTRTAPCP